MRLTGWWVTKAEDTRGRCGVQGVSFRSGLDAVTRRRHAHRHAAHQLALAVLAVGDLAALIVGLHPHAFAAPLRPGPDEPAPAARVPGLVRPLDGLADEG